MNVTARSSCLAVLNSRLTAVAVAAIAIVIVASACAGASSAVAKGSAAKYLLPDTVIDDGPSGTTGDNTPTFRYHSENPSGGTIFECRNRLITDDETSDWYAKWRRCDGGSTTLGPLADGPYRFQVRSLRLRWIFGAHHGRHARSFWALYLPAAALYQRDPTPAERIYTVETGGGEPDTTPPTLSIDSPTEGETLTTDTVDVTFTAADPESGVSSTTCQLDAGVIDLCGSPKTYTGLANGPHSVTVVATNGESLATTVVRGFSVSVTPRPANDDFANAIALAPSFFTSAAGSNIGATKEAGEPDHAGQPGGSSIWYSWTAPSDGRLTLRTEGSTADTLLAVYTGVSVNALTPVGANDDVGGTVPPVWSRVTVPVVSGQQYWIAIDGSASSTGSITLTLSQVAIPLNDNFANADTIALPDTFNINNIAALKEAGEPDHAGDPGRGSLWFKVTPTTDGKVGIDTLGSGFDTLIGVYTGASLGALVSVAANDDSTGGVESRVVFDAVAGTTYYVALDGKLGATGDFTVHADFTIANDDFADAAVVPNPLPARIPGSNFVATKEPGEPNHDGDPGGASIWYSWTPDASGIVTIDTFDSDPGFDSVLAVYTGSTIGALTPVISNDEAVGISCCQSMVQFSVTAGTTYKIVIDGFLGSEPAAAVGTTMLTVAWKPANDDLVGAADLGSDSTASIAGSTFGATKEAAEPPHAGLSGGRSLWYTWTAPATGSVTIDTIGSAFDTLLGVYSGAAYPLTLIAANDDASGSVTQSSVTFSATAGAVYRIALDGRFAAGGDFQLNLVAAGDTTPPTLLITAPTEGEILTTATVDVSFTAGVDAVSVTCQVDTGSVEADCVSPKTYTGLTDGPHSVTVVARDSAGNPNSQTRNFTVSATPPPPPPASFEVTWSITSSTTQAAAHPALTAEVSISPNSSDLRTASVKLPNGFWGSLASVPAPCEIADANAGTCDASTRIGTVYIEGTVSTGPTSAGGEIYLTEGPTLDSPGGMSVKIVHPTLGTAIAQASVDVENNGGNMRMTFADIPNVIGTTPGHLTLARLMFDQTVASTGTPLLTNSSSCVASSFTGSFGAYNSETSVPAAISYGSTGCASVPFAPTLDLAFTNPNAGEVSGVVANVTIPPNNSSLRTVNAKLPQSIGANFPAFGSQAVDLCPSANDKIATFDTAACPPQAQVGTVLATTPLLPTPVSGTAWLINKSPLPWVGLELTYQGVLIKVIGSTSLPQVDPTCSPDFDTCQSQIAATFGTNAQGLIPDVPVAEVVLDLDSMVRAPLTGSATPAPKILVIAGPGECLASDASSTWAMIPHRGAPNATGSQTQAFIGC